MAIDSTPTPPPRPLGRRTFRGTSPPPAGAGDRLFRLQVLRASKPSRSSKLDPSDGRRRVLYAPTPVVPSTADVTKSQPLVSLDATENSTHHCLSQHHLQPVSGHSRDDVRARSPVGFPKREPDEDHTWFPPRPLAAAISRRRLLSEAGTNNLQPLLASRSGGDHRSPQYHLQRTSGHPRDDARARSPIALPKREPYEDRVKFPPRPLAATPIARRRLLDDAGANNLQLPIASRSGGVVAAGGGATQSLDATRSQPHILHNATGQTAYRVISRHRFTCHARPSQGDTRSSSPEVAIKNEPEEDLTPLVSHLPDAASTSRLSLGRPGTVHKLEAPFGPECKEEIQDLPKTNPSLKYGRTVLREGNPEIPLLAVSRQETVNKRNTEAPTASINRPQVPSLSTVTQHTTTMDRFNAMFPWAKYSVELNRPTNVSLRSSAVKREPTLVLVTGEENFDASDAENESSESESAESDRGSKRTRDEASDDDGESVGDEEVEEQRPLRRRKLLWAD